MSLDKDIIVLCLALWSWGIKVAFLFLFNEKLRIIEELELDIKNNSWLYFCSIMLLLVKKKIVDLCKLF